MRSSHKLSSGRNFPEVWLSLRGTQQESLWSDAFITSRKCPGLCYLSKVTSPMVSSTCMDHLFHIVLFLVCRPLEASSTLSHTRCESSRRFLAVFSHGLIRRAAIVFTRELPDNYREYLQQLTQTFSCSHSAPLDHFRRSAGVQ